MSTLFQQFAFNTTTQQILVIIMIIMVAGQQQILKLFDIYPLKKAGLDRLLQMCIF